MPAAPAPTMTQSTSLALELEAGFGACRARWPNAGPAAMAAEPRFAVALGLASRRIPEPGARAASLGHRFLHWISDSF